MASATSGSTGPTASSSACGTPSNVAYATDLKATLLGVPHALLDAVGPVDPEVALAMPHGGHPPGTFHVAVAGPAGDAVRSVRTDADGGRAGVRAAARDAAVALLLERVNRDLGGTPDPPPTLESP